MKKYFQFYIVLRIKLVFLNYWSVFYSETILCDVIESERFIGEI